MSKLIVEMEMPKGGCLMCDARCVSALHGYICGIKRKNVIPFLDKINRPDWCPIVGLLPDEHGDLIDRNYLLKFFDGINSCIDKEDVLSAETVIAAERKDDGK